MALSPVEAGLHVKGALGPFVYQFLGIGHPWEGPSHHSQHHKVKDTVNIPCSSGGPTPWCASFTKHPRPQGLAARVAGTPGIPAGPRWDLTPQFPGGRLSRFCVEAPLTRAFLTPQTGGVGSFDIAGLLNNPSFMSMVTAPACRVTTGPGPGLPHCRRHGHWAPWGVEPDKMNPPLPAE